MGQRQRRAKALGHCRDREGQRGVATAHGDARALLSLILSGCVSVELRQWVEAKWMFSNLA